MPKTPEQKLEKAAGKATATLLGLLERSIEARAGYAERLRALLEDE